MITNMDILFIILCLFTSINCFIIGCVLTYAIDYRINRQKIIDKSIDFDKAIKITSEANNSIADKIVEIEHKISDISMSINSIRTNTWGKQ